MAETVEGDGAVQAARRLLTVSFQEELRLPLPPVIAGLVVLGDALMLAGEVFSLSNAVVLTGGLLCLLAVLVGLVDQWQPRIARWLAVIALVGMVLSVHSWLALPGSLALLVIPVALAGALISLPAALAMAAGVTGLVLLLGQALAWAAPLAVIWGTLGLLWSVHRAAERLAGYAGQEFQSARSTLEEARSRRAQLKQALADLARANRELYLINQKLAAARRVAEEAERTKATFVANVSHELRTPLNMILGFSEMITETPKTYSDSLPPALLADLAVILRNAQHLSSLIDDVLDLSQIEAGKMALTKERVAISEVAEAARTAVARLFSSRNLYLKIEVPPHLPAVFCDRTRVREVLLNLLSNAARFTKEGGVRVRARQEGGDIVVSVMDTGPGIATEDAAQLFRPFQQLDGSIRRRDGGWGLGLGICKSFVELHGGQMWLESVVGRGTTFFFRLPIDPPATADGLAGRWLSAEWEYEQRTRPSRAPAPDARPRLVLLEPEKALQRLLTRYLDWVEIAPVHSLAAAGAELARLPALALLVNDPSVPKALQSLEAAGVLPAGTPAILCSVPGAARAVEALGVSDYLVKPISRDRLLAALDRLQLRGKTVLVVDDEPEALRLFWRMLASSGEDYRVLTARDGQRALQIMRDQRPDVVLLDLVMPEMDGFRLLEVRSQEAVLRDIPVVVLSARDPLGQPVVASALAVTQAGGLAVHHLLAYIEATRRIFGGTRSGAPPSLGNPACGPACA